MSTNLTPDAAPPPVQRWYCKRANGQDGPWSAEQLLAEAAAGRVTPDDLVKTDAMSEWVDAKSVNGLDFPERPRAGPPTPTRPGNTPGPAVGPPPLPTQPPPLPVKPRPKSVPPTQPGRRPTADAPRPRYVSWKYVGAAVVMLTVGLGVAVVVLKDRGRADVASLPNSARPPEPAVTDRPTPPQPTNRSNGPETPAQTKTDTGSPAVPPPTAIPTGDDPPATSSQQPKPTTADDSILVRLRGTRWENSNGVTFEWTADGKFLHKGVERPCKEVGPLSVEIDFGGGHRDTLVFDSNLTRFDQYSTKGGDGPLFTGRRSNSTPRPLAVGESVVLRGHKGYVWNVAFSKDGSKLLTVSQQGPVVLWDVANRSQVWWADVPGDLRAAAFIDADRKVAVQRTGGLVALDAGSGTVEDEARFPANGWGKFSPDGRYLALTTVNDSKSRIHSVPSGRVLYEHPARYATSQRGYAFSRDGAGCYAGINDVFRLDLTANPSPVRTNIRQQTIEAMDVSPDGKRLVTGSGRVWQDKLKKDAQGDNCVRVWDIPSGRVVATLKGHDGWLWSVCFHPDGKRVLSGGCGQAEPLDFYGHRPGADTSLRLWDVATQRQLERFEGHTAAVLDIKCSPDGRYAATGSADGTVRLWRLPD